MESLNDKLRDECVKLQIATTLTESQVLIQRAWRKYNQVRLHSALEYQAPAIKTLEIGLLHRAPFAHWRSPQ